MSWRPEGWDAGEIAKKAKLIDIFSYRCAVEAGADAIIELLKANGRPIECGKYPFYWENEEWLPPYSKGVCAFIPEEQP